MAKQSFTSGQTLLASQMTDLQTNDFNWTVSTQTANYTLQAADKGTREVMNMSSAGTVTVPNNTFNAGDIVWVHSIGSGTITIAAGTGLTLNSAAGSAPTLAQWEGGVVYFTSASSSIFFRGGGTGYGVATGGTSASRTVGGVNYTVLTFASDDNLVVSKAGLFDVLLVGGGGGGAGSPNGVTSGGGGGGAGALVGYASTTTLYLAAGTYAVDVGAGGAGTQGPATGHGAASYIGSVISAAGGGCANGYNTLFLIGGDGGSGGGSTNAVNGKSIDETFGNDGGTGNDGAASGGGGGYASVGGNHGGGTGGAGGNGQDVSSWGTSASTDNVAAGGGGSGNAAGGAAGTGGVAGKTSGAGNNATTAGSGGGGTYGSNTTGGNGAAGKVWVRFKQ